MKNTIKFIPGNRAGIAVNPEKDGIIEVRPGTKGINLGERKYAMAYIRVLNEHKYLKGMCLYSDNLPDEYDVIKYCRNPVDCLKALMDDRDPDIRIKTFNKGVMTKITNDGDWSAWKESLHPTPNLAYKFLRKKGSK